MRIIASFLLLLVVGCQTTNQTGVPIVMDNSSHSFPSYLAGVWRQDGPLQREFSISTDGRVESAVLGMGMVSVMPNQETRVSLTDGGEGFFVPGEWAASYDPVLRELQISIEMTSFQMQSGKQAVEGVIRESFVGVISEDGKRWDVDYFALPEYHGFTRTGEHVVLMDGAEPDQQKLVFFKIESLDN